MCGLSPDGKKRLRALWQHSQKCHRTNGKITLTQSDFPAGCEFGDCRDQCNRSPALPQSLQHSFAENTTLPTVPRADAERALHGLLPQHHVRLPGWYSRSWCPLVGLYPAPWRSSQEPWVEHVALSMCCWASIPLFVTLWDRLRSTGQNDLSRYDTRGANMTPGKVSLAAIIPFYYWPLLWCEECTFIWVHLYLTMQFSGSMKNIFHEHKKIVWLPSYVHMMLNVNKPHFRYQWPVLNDLWLWIYYFHKFVSFRRSSTVHLN